MRYELLTVVCCAVWSVISKDMAGVNGGCPKTCFQVFLQGNKLQQASQVKKIVAFISFNQCYLGNCNIFCIYYFPATFAGSVACGTTNIQPSFCLRDCKSFGHQLFYIHINLFTLIQSYTVQKLQSKTVLLIFFSGGGNKSHFPAKLIFSSFK